MNLRQKILKLKETLEENHTFVSEYYLSGEEIPWMREETIKVERYELEDLFNTLGEDKEVKTLSELRKMLQDDYSEEQTIRVMQGTPLDVSVVRISKNDLFNYLDQLLEVNERTEVFNEDDITIYETER